jgi:N-acetylglucosaminyl-diphospho-decaprenol L-rhamnosyltransferase
VSAGTAPPVVDVIVVTWNSARVLPGLLASLPAGLTGLKWRLTIVDNASADDTVAVARAGAPGCQIVQTGRNAGYAAAFNAGLARCAGYDAVLILNPDIRLAPGCGAMLCRALGETPTGAVGIAVPQLRDEDGTLARSLRREPTLLRALGQAVLGDRANRYPRLGEAVLDDETYARPADVDWATGAIMLMSRECLARCGTWDESFFLYSEETDYALRARDAGLATRLVPAAQAVHIGGESKVSPALWSLLTVNRVRLYRKRHNRFAAALYWSTVLLGEAARAGLGRRRSQCAVIGLLHRAGLPRG